jgi:hypothetical protein
MRLRYIRRFLLHVLPKRNHAKGAHIEDDKVAWREMAKRWRQCAETSRNHGAALANGLEQKPPAAAFAGGAVTPTGSRSWSRTRRLSEYGLEALDCLMLRTRR